MSWRDKKRAQALVENLEKWHATCVEVTQLCARALHEPMNSNGDIGEVIDYTDRKLYTFRSHMQDARSELRRHDQELADRLAQVTEDVYRLRNQTASFLIRAQGAQPFAGKHEIDEAVKQRAYHRALDESGFEGRRLAEGLQAEADRLWQDLKPLLDRAYQTAA